MIRAIAILVAFAGLCFWGQHIHDETPVQPEAVSFGAEAAFTPTDGRTAFLAVQDPDIYWVLDTVDLGTNCGDSVAGGDDNTAVASGDITTIDSWQGMNNQNDDGATSDFDIHLTNDSAWIMYIPSGMSHGTVYGLWHNGGGTNAQGSFARPTATGVEIACAHNDGGDFGDYIIHEIADAELDDWFMIGCQFNSNGGVETTMAIWVNGVEVGSGTRTYPLDYGSGDPDFGNNSGREPNQSEVRYPVSYSGGDWGGNNAIDGSGILISNFVADNATGGGADDSAGNGDDFYTDYFTAHNASAPATPEEPNGRPTLLHNGDRIIVQ